MIRHECPSKPRRLAGRRRQTQQDTGGFAALAGGAAESAGDCAWREPAHPRPSPAVPRSPAFIAVPGHLADGAFSSLFTL